MIIENTLITVISLSTPLVIAVIGETISEKSGVINLSAEGTIMFSALCGFVFGYLTDFAIVGFLSAAICGGIISTVISYCDIKLRMDIVSSFIEDAKIREKIREILGYVSDIYRITAKISVNKSSPRDLYNLALSLTQSSKICDLTNDISAKELNNLIKSFISIRLSPYVSKS